MKKLWVVALLFVVGCSLPERLTVLTVQPSVANLALGQQVQMTAIGTWTRAGNRDMTQTVTWSADVQGILNVGQHGLMTAAACGQATVTAKYVDRGNAVFGRAPVSVC